MKLAHISILILILLAGCAQDRTVATGEPPAKSSTMSLDEMDTGFLYMAAQNAISQGNPDLAIRLLTALVEKDPDAVVPSLELAELLIERQRPDLAQGLLQSLSQRQDLTPEQRDHVQLLNARMLASMRQYEDALKALQPFLARNPGDVDARRLQAQMLVNLNRTGEAVAVIGQALRSQDDPDLYLMLAQLYLQQEKPDAAVTVLKKMHKLSPDDDRPALMMSQIALQRNQTAEGEGVLRDFLDGHPDSLRVSNALGQLLVRQGRYDDAIVIYKEMENRTGGDADVLKALGLLYYQIRDFDQAEATFRKLLDQGDDDEARFYYAASLEALGRENEARALYQKVDTSSPQYTEAQIRLAGIDAKNGAMEKAAERLKKVIGDQPKNTDAYLILSGIRLQQKHYQQLLDETAPATALPTLPLGLIFNRAVAYEFLKNHDAAETALRQILNIDPRHADSLNFLGYSLAERGIRLDEAEKLIRRALEIKPDDGYYLDSLAWVFFQRGNYAEAARIQKQALTRVENDPVMLEHMGDIQWKLGDQAAARETWQQALKQGHEKPEEMKKKIKQGL